MGGYILRQEEETLVLPAGAVDRLIGKADGDAALLYLTLMRSNSAVTPQTLMARLHWSELRLHAAESTLQQLGLLQQRAQTPPPEPADEHPTYTTDDIAGMLEGDEGFKMLVPMTEEKLGKKLKTNDLQILAGLYDDLGLPADVLYLLVSYCVNRSQQRYGLGRRPTMRQIEKEGYYWARLGLFDQEKASAYLVSCARKDEEMTRYMQVLGLGTRPPVESEAKYIRHWMEQGFTTDAVALAYDKTVLYKKELNWRYLNGILRRWHENGWHTLEEVQQGDGKKKAPAKNNDDGMDKYLNW